MAALSNIPTTSRCRVDLYSDSATRILPLSGGGKGALCLGGSRAVCWSLMLPSPRALLPMAAKGLSPEEASGTSRHQPAPSSYLRHQPFASPPDVSQTLGTTHTSLLLCTSLTGPYFPVCEMMLITSCILGGCETLAIHCPPQYHLPRGW